MNTRLTSVALLISFFGLLGGAAARADVECPIEYLDAPGGGNAVPVCHDVPSKGPPLPPKPDVWGAIALSPDTSGWGIFWNAGSRAAAEQGALKQCQAQKGNRDCRPAMTVVNACVAVAFSKADLHLAVGGPYDAIDLADDRALINCIRIGGKFCTVTGHVCADGVQHRALAPVPAGRQARR
jgi:hypothetical protein